MFKQSCFILLGVPLLAVLVTFGIGALARQTSRYRRALGTGQDETLGRQGLGFPGLPQVEIDGVNKINQR